jgi:hypothetical protein
MTDDGITKGVLPGGIAGQFPAGYVDPNQQGYGVPGQVPGGYGQQGYGMGGGGGTGLIGELLGGGLLAGGVVGGGMMMHEEHPDERREGMMGVDHPRGTLDRFLGGSFSQGMGAPREGFTERHIMRDLL